MAIMDNPNLLLLDEPVSGIDQNGMKLFFETMEFLKTHYDLAIILISHDLDYVKKYADHVALIDKTIVCQGNPEKVFNSQEFERIFKGDVNSWFDVEQDVKERSLDYVAEQFGTKED
jgi:zinc transport system ATP-binding protein